MFRFPSFSFFSFDYGSGLKQYQIYLLEVLKPGPASKLIFSRKKGQGICILYRPAMLYLYNESSIVELYTIYIGCLLYTSPSPRD